MATVDELTQTLTDVQSFVSAADTALDDVRTLITAQITEIADLKKQLADGGAITQAQLDALAKQAEGIKTAAASVATEADDLA